MCFQDLMAQSVTISIFSWQGIGQVRLYFDKVRWILTARCLTPQSLPRVYSSVFRKQSDNEIGKPILSILERVFADY